MKSWQDAMASERVRCAFEESAGAITVEEFIHRGFQERHYLWAMGKYRWVSNILWASTDPWAVCPHDNGGLGASYCVHYGTRLVPESQLDRLPIVMAVMHNVQLEASGPRGNYLRVRWNDGETEDIEADSAGNHEEGNRS
jgi:hypothetical protein